MADIDEDPPINSQSNNDEDHEADDETQDFRLIANLVSKSSLQIPKRGEKDFEHHGTKQQDRVLAASRQAMHDVLDYTRVHTPKTHLRAYYYGPEGFDRDEVFEAQWRQGLEDDHIVVVENAKGTMFKTMGKTSTGIRHPNLWLLPEEALYLVERGNLDLWWPSRSSYRCLTDEENKRTKGSNESDQDEDEGFPISLQAAYALLIGNKAERGKVSLEKYAVYANLKRSGYVVLRSTDSNPLLKDVRVQASTSIFTWLFGRLFAEEEVKHSTFGPLVKPGMYRSYNSIYRQISIIPRHKPTPLPENPAPIAEPPFSLVFGLWKATRIPTFAKSNPGIPDFRLAIVDARSSSMPTLTQMTSLLESTPWDPPPPQLNHPAKMYQRLKHGYRNVILAVIDQGIISYLRLSETAFGEEKMYEKFDRAGANNAGTKRGAGESRGRGGRGGGRGRGGRGRGQK